MIIYEEHLSETDQLTAEYLSAVSDYRRLAAEFAFTLHESGSADLTPLDVARKRLEAIESNDDFIHAQMLPLAEAAARLSYSRAQMTRICRDHGPDGSRQVRAEKRHGKLWYIYTRDVEFLIATGELRGPY